MRRSKKKSSNSQEKFEGPGVDFKSKLIGVTDVVGPRGDEICSDALSVLKASALRNNKEKKEHKQRITVNITLKGIRLIDEATERIDHAHPISRISFISLDKSDKRTFGYIVGTKDGYKFFAIKTAKEAEIITATLKELFQEVYKRHQEKKVDAEEEAVEEEATPSEAEVNGKIEEAEEAVESTEGANDSQMIWELNDQIEEMQNVGMIAHSTSFDMMDDPFNVGGTVAAESKGDPFDDNFAPTPVQKNDSLIDELGNGSLGNEKVVIPPLPSPIEIKRQKTSNTDLLSDVPPVSIKPSSSYHDDLQLMVDTPIQNGIPEVQEPLMTTSDPFADLKKSINQIHQQNMINQQQQQMSFLPTFPSQMNQQVPIAMNHPNQYSQNISNPFASNGFNENTYPPSIPARPTPPVIPARPGVSVKNPFLPQQPPNQNLAEPSMGWTVLKTSPIPKKKEIDMSIPDPFSFLNDQQNLSTKTHATPATNNNQSTGNSELLDLLG